MNRAASSFQIDPATLAIPVVLAALAALVAMRLADRARSYQGRWLRVWLLCAGLSLGAGIWGTHFAAAIVVRASETPLGFDFMQVLASLGTGVVLCSLAFQLAHRFHGMAGTVSGAALAAAGALGTHYLGLLALQVKPELHWDTSGIAGSGVVALALCLGAFLLFFHTGSFRDLKASTRQLAASALLTSGLIGMLLVSFSGLFTQRTESGAEMVQVVPVPDELLWAIAIGALSVVLTLLLIASLVDADLESNVRALSEALRSARTRLNHLASHDGLTQLLNRVAFDRQLERAVAEAQARRSQMAVFFVDLDNFKILNGAWGPQAGDEILQQVARRLQEIARSGDAVARVGWDQFAVLMRQVNAPQLMTAAAQRMVTALAQPMDTPHGVARLSCSVGIAPHPAAGEPGQLLSRAHAAMLAARAGGGNTFRFFEQAGDPGSEEMVGLQQQLRQALEQEELELHYQPVVRTGDLQPCAIEALIRWRHPTRGLLAPASFLAQAERFELSIEIGRWVLEEAASQVAAWNQLGLRLPVSVNAFPSQVRMPGLAAQLLRVQQKFELPPGSLTLEVGEAVLLSATPATEQLFGALREVGIPGSIDNFGQTACNLLQLRALRPQEVKLDRALVTKLETSADALALIDAVIRLAHALDIRVVAKGVETARQRDALLALGCDQMQGLLFWRALPANELTDQLLKLQPAQLDAVFSKA